MLGKPHKSEQCVKVLDANRKPGDKDGNDLS